MPSIRFGGNPAIQQPAFPDLAGPSNSYVTVDNSTNPDDSLGMVSKQFKLEGGEEVIVGQGQVVEGEGTTG